MKGQRQRDDSAISVPVPDPVPGELWHLMTPTRTRYAQVLDCHGGNVLLKWNNAKGEHTLVELREFKIRWRKEVLRDQGMLRNEGSRSVPDRSEESDP